MPLLEAVRTRYVSTSIRLPDTTAVQVDQYAAFISASADDVVEQALAYVFSKDRDFQEFLKSPKRRRSHQLCAFVGYPQTMMQSQRRESQLPLHHCQPKPQQLSAGSKA